jgi:hypothetical protein
MARRVTIGASVAAEADRLALQVERCSAICGSSNSSETSLLKRKAAARRVMQAKLALRANTARLNDLEQQRVAQLPDLKTRLVDILQAWTRRLCADGVRRRGLREFARAMRAVAALTTINEQRMAEHRRTLARTAAAARSMEHGREQLEQAAQEAQRAGLPPSARSRPGKHSSRRSTSVATSTPNSPANLASPQRLQQQLVDPERPRRCEP